MDYNQHTCFLILSLVLKFLPHFSQWTSAFSKCFASMCLLMSAFLFITPQATHLQRPPPWFTIWDSVSMFRAWPVQVKCVIKYGGQNLKIFIEEFYKIFLYGCTDSSWNWIPCCSWDKNTQNGWGNELLRYDFSHKWLFCLKTWSIFHKWECFHHFWSRIAASHLVPWYPLNKEIVNFYSYNILFFLK